MCQPSVLSFRLSCHACNYVHFLTGGVEKKAYLPVDSEGLWFLLMRLGGKGSRGIAHHRLRKAISRLVKIGSDDVNHLLIIHVWS